MAKGNSSKTANGSALEFEAQLWAAADKLRGHRDASEYCLRKFASAEGKGGGEFYTPQCVVEVLVALLEPYKGRVFETLQSANANCSNRRMNGDFSLSASNGERAGVRCRNQMLHLSNEMARETICRTAISNSSGDFPPPSLMLLARPAGTGACRRAIIAKRRAGD